MERQTLVKISQVFSALLTGEKTADELSLLIYNNLGSAHLGFIFSILESQIEADVVTPIFRDRKIYFCLKNQDKQGAVDDKEKIVSPTDPISHKKKLLKRDIETKMCPKCKKEKELTEFADCKKYKDKKDVQCRECRRKYQEVYYKNITKPKKEKQLNHHEKHITLSKEIQNDALDIEDAGICVAPEGMFTFLKWLENSKKTEFSLDDFHKDNPALSLQQIEKIVTYQIKQKSLLQLSRDLFRVVK